jgi:hypothetical protein
MNSEKEVAEKLVKKALKLRKEIGEVATWCDRDEVLQTTTKSIQARVDINNESTLQDYVSEIERA